MAAAAAPAGLVALAIVAGSAPVPTVEVVDELLLSRPRHHLLKGMTWLLPPRRQPRRWANVLPIIMDWGCSGSARPRLGSRFRAQSRSSLRAVQGAHHWPVWRRTGSSGGYAYPDDGRPSSAALEPDEPSASRAPNQRLDLRDARCQSWVKLCWPMTSSALPSASQNDLCAP